MVNQRNDNILYKGQLLQIEGAPLTIGMKAPACRLSSTELFDVRLDDYAGKTLIVSTVPSVDTSTCAAQTVRFNREVQTFGQTVQLLTVSMDLPFAQKRFSEENFCSIGAFLSDYKYREFGAAYGVLLAGWRLLARAVFVISPDQLISYVEYCPNLSEEPDYQACLQALRG